MDKTEKVNVRISEKMKAKALVRCMDLGMNLSDYIRYLITKDVEENYEKQIGKCGDRQRVEPNPISGLPQNNDDLRPKAAKCEGEGKMNNGILQSAKGF